VVGVPDGWSSGKLADAVARRTGTRRLIDLSQVCIDLASDAVTCGGENLLELDAIVVKKLGFSYERELLDRVELLNYLEQRGVRIFSKPRRIGRLLNRLTCTLDLQLAHIPMPETVITEDIAQAEAAVHRFGQAVCKPLFTSKARGMVIIETGPDTRSQLEAFREAGHSVLYVQRKVALPGNDLGIVFLGGRHLGSYARHAGVASWNTTTHSGGKYQPCDPPPAIIDLACKAQSPFDLDFTCVDIAETPDGPVVFEVSAFGGFRGLLESCGIDAAERYADYVIERIRHDG